MTRRKSRQLLALLATSRGAISRAELIEKICVLTAPELDFSSRGRLPANVHYVGPSFEPHATEWRSPWPEANTDPLVLISFSTTYMNQVAVVQRVLDAVVRVA